MAGSKEKNGIFIAENLVLALTHTTSVRREGIVPTPFGPLLVERNIIREEHFLGGKQLELVGRNGDISLFRTEEPYDVFPFAFGDFSRVHIGDQVIVIGFSYNKQINVKGGIVAALNNRHREGKEEICSEFILSVPINFGDSGSPVLARRTDTRQYEIIGLVSAKCPSGEQIGFAYKIDCVKKLIDRILDFEFCEF